ncbi:MAG TPA: SDR family NAD(P)-dependent oxidoreductase [Aestuariivirgaceae bacterium]|jgi:3-oxoacyl-[acyl-carrier protein] reductase|nr:SDR family NAD(P)-dependent oxidoreductase [Aestuariivirgaceae bacterium]
MNRIDLQGQIAVVTGAAQGIGLAIARRLGQSGAKVALWDIDETLVGAAAASLAPAALPVRMDIARPEEAERAAAETEARLGPIAILVNSAGIAGQNATLDVYPVEEWRRVIDINLNGTFYANRAVVAGMKTRNYGRIINIASVAGKEGNPNAAAYSASKAGVIALTKSLGKELAGFDIAVNCITPAAARTRIFEQMTEEHIQYMLSKIPRGRFVAVDEIAAMVAWMASSENSFTTGAVFDLSGGRATY